MQRRAADGVGLTRAGDEWRGRKSGVEWRGMRGRSEKDEHRQIEKEQGEGKRKSVVAKPHSYSHSSHAGHFIGNSDHFQHAPDLFLGEVWGASTLLGVDEIPECTVQYSTITVQYTARSSRCWCSWGWLLFNNLGEVKNGRKNEPSLPENTPYLALPPAISNLNWLHSQKGPFFLLFFSFTFSTVSLYSSFVLPVYPALLPSSPPLVLLVPSTPSPLPSSSSPRLPLSRTLHQHFIPTPHTRPTMVIYNSLRLYVLPNLLIQPCDLLAHNYSIKLMHLSSPISSYSYTNADTFTLEPAHNDPSVKSENIVIHRATGELRFNGGHRRHLVLHGQRTCVPEQSS
jgi:hypothetical protein